jgi:acyl carrier protein
VSVQAIIVEEMIRLLDGGQPVPQFAEKTELGECGLDSVSYLKLLLRLQERFGKDVFAGDAALPATVGDLVKTFEGYAIRSLKIAS